MTKTYHYTCSGCGTAIEMVKKPKLTLMGFRKVICTKCGQLTLYPLPTGYAVFLWLLLALQVALLILAVAVVAQGGGMFTPNPLAIIVLVLVVISLVKNQKIKKEIGKAIVAPPSA